MHTYIGTHIYLKSYNHFKGCSRYSMAKCLPNMFGLSWYLVQKKDLRIYNNCLFILKFKYILYRAKCIGWNNFSVQVIMKYLWHVSINYYIWLGTGVQAEKVNRQPFQHTRHSEANNQTSYDTFKIVL